MIRAGYITCLPGAALRLPPPSALCLNKRLLDRRLWTMADRRLQVFHAVAKQMSFTKAAETLFMTQPAVTFQIKQLEEQYNTRLFERGHGRVALTSAGEIVYDYAERILGLSAELDTRLKEMTGRLSGPLLI